MAKPSLMPIYTTEDIKAHAERYGLDTRIRDNRGRAQHIVMPQRGNRVAPRYSAEQIEWATFVLCGGSFHGSAKLAPWTSGIIGRSVTRPSFEAWGRQVASRRLGGVKLTMSEVAGTVGLPLRTFHRYVTGASEQIAKALNGAGVSLL